MFRDLAEDCVGQDAPASRGVGLDHCRGGFVAGAFNAKHAEAGSHENLPPVLRKNVAATKAQLSRLRSFPYSPPPHQMKIVK
jgi:hypothetical protein